MKKIKIEFTNERIIPASGLAVVGAILGKCDFVKRCNRMDDLFEKTILAMRSCEAAVADAMGHEEKQDAAEQVTKI